MQRTSSLLPDSDVNIQKLKRLVMDNIEEEERRVGRKREFVRG
ncbi:hypothetical protein E2C01_060305 [Portunus trituberculatus]|uniref:Uncharacterized protein n=1 Tax=Portunus trituberculatus TaxID=210409 RepID=A0A5B7H238_PORTR|nr:hypothetical protein [Portunus trituberculatus]